MSIEIIDILKPKNGLSFKLIEDIDIAVQGYTSLADAVSHFVTTESVQQIINAALSGKQDKLTETQMNAVNSGITSELVTQIGTNTTAIAGKASQADLTALETEVDGKADASDLTTATASLQAQIDNIVSGSTADSEVINARVDVEGTNHTTLKSRIDSTENKINTLQSEVINTDNLLTNATIVPNNYYSGGTEHSSASYSYAIVPMLSSKTYVISAARFIAYSTGSAVETSVSDGFEFTPSADGDVYISFYNDTTSYSEWKVYEKGKDGTRIGTYQHPALNTNVLADTLGNNNGIAISQKAVTDAINAPIDMVKLNGIAIKDGTDLTPFFTEQGDGGYYASGVGGTISPVTSSGYKYFKLPVDGAATYYLDNSARWYFTTDASNNVVDCSTESQNTEFTVSATAKLLWVTYTTDIATTRKIARNNFPIQDTLYIMPQNTKDSYLDSLGDISNFFYNKNLLDTASLVSNKYYSNGSYHNNNSYSVFIFNVESGKSYKFGCAVRFLSKKDSDIGSSLAANYTYTADYTGEIYASIENTLSNQWKAVELPTDIDAVNPRGVSSINPDMIAHGVGGSKSLLMSQYGVTQAVLSNPKLYGKSFAQATGNLSNGQSLTVPRTNLKKNNLYSFMAYITTFDTILIGHGKNTSNGSWLEINDTNVIFHSYGSSDTTRTYAHELTIKDYIYVQIKIKVEAADVTVYSNGQTYTVSDVIWTGDGNGDTFAESSGSTLTNCVFTWSSADFRKSTWMFGDSYFSMTSNTRWVKYMVDAGYDNNVLLNAYPGENTTHALTALNNAIEYYGKPNFIVWCLGMNDGSDTDENTPSATWLTGVNRVLEIANTYGMTPIFATIPTVPEINHEGKNKYIRNSGYRYIDFAKAVGATSEGVWFDGMLSQDGVHPDVAGAIALYHRAIADCPEITYSNP